MYKLNKLKIMISINDFDESLVNDVNMLNIIDAILIYKKDIKVLTSKQIELLEKLNSKDGDKLSKLRQVQQYLLDAATQDFMEKIDKNKDFDVKGYYKTNIKTIIKHFENLNGYIKKFYNDAMLKLKNDHELNINKLLYMYISKYILSNTEQIHDLYSQIESYLKNDSVKSVKNKIQTYLNTKKELEISMIEIFKTLEKHIIYIYAEFYKIYEIGINENEIFKTQISSCLSSNDSILFITINEKAKDGNFVYTALCITKNQFLTFIRNQKNIKYPCNYDDPITYISMPIGPPQKKIQTDPKTSNQTETQTNSDVYISYLTAIMIYKQNTKFIFYLLRKKDSPDITNVNSYCDIQDNIPIMYIATCAGGNCKTKND